MRLCKNYKNGEKGRKITADWDFSEYAHGEQKSLKIYKATSNPTSESEGRYMTQELESTLHILPFF